MAESGVDLPRREGRAQHEGRGASWWTVVEVKMRRAGGVSWPPAPHGSALMRLSSGSHYACTHPRTARAPAAGAAYPRMAWPRVGRAKGPDGHAGAWTFRPQIPTEQGNSTPPQRATRPAGGMVSAWGGGAPAPCQTRTTRATSRSAPAARKIPASGSDASCRRGPHRHGPRAGRGVRLLAPVGRAAKAGASGGKAHSSGKQEDHPRWCHRHGGAQRGPPRWRVCALAVGLVPRFAKADGWLATPILESPMSMVMRCKEDAGRCTETPRHDLLCTCPRVPQRAVRGIEYLVGWYCQGHRCQAHVW